MRQEPPVPGEARVLVRATLPTMIHAHSAEELNLEKSWLTIGVFDGVHRGHQQIIRRLVDGAHARGAAAVAMSFWPHPASVLGSQDVKVLTMPDERARLMSGLGLDVFISQPFNHDVANTTAFDFVSRLKKHLGFERLLIGYDFALGKGREGNASRLTEMGADLGYSVEVMPALSDESGVISSTEIRKLVAIGNVAEAAVLLGHCYGLHGPVVHGDGRGRQLGFPTANIDYPHEKVLPANGVYACRVWVDGNAYGGAINVGVRPQFHASAERPLVEAYILDFDRDIYGEDVRLEFVERLRAEQKFPSVEALVERMHQDVDRARTLLGSEKSR
jgi:riboflavin kinase/FMN adenylyltransferase